MKDMINDMYAKEMRSGNMNEWEIIDKYGYLGIASEYIRRKGYHEAIDVYIEQRTPILVENEDGTYDLFLGKEHEENVDVSLHRRLLDMKVKNIYTFNYDNALEVYSDLTSTSERRKELEETYGKIELIDKTWSKLRQLNSDTKKAEVIETTDSVEVGITNEDTKRQIDEIKKLPIVKSVCDISNDSGENTSDTVGNDLKFVKSVIDKLKIIDSNYGILSSNGIRIRRKPIMS